METIRSAFRHRGWEETDLEGRGFRWEKIMNPIYCTFMVLTFRTGDSIRVDWEVAIQDHDDIELEVKEQQIRRLGKLAHRIEHLIDQQMQQDDFRPFRVLEVETVTLANEMGWLLQEGWQDICVRHINTGCFSSELEIWNDDFMINIDGWGVNANGEELTHICVLARGERLTQEHESIISRDLKHMNLYLRTYLSVYAEKDEEVKVEESFI